VVSHPCALPALRGTKRPLRERQARSSSATHSMCGVCGNMSTGVTRRSA
jgi:hypothetical protein